MVKLFWRYLMLDKIYNFFKVVSLAKYNELEHKYNKLKINYDRLKMDYERLQDKPDHQAHKIEHLEQRISEVERTNRLLMRGLGIDEFTRVLQEAELKENRKNKSKNKLKGSEKIYE